MHKRLNHFLEQHKIFYALLFGFRLDTSTKNALMSITENTQTHSDKNKVTAGVFIDLRRPFILLTMTSHLQNLTTMEFEGWLMTGSAHT